MATDAQIAFEVHESLKQEHGHIEQVREWTRVPAEERDRWASAQAAVRREASNKVKSNIQGERQQELEAHRSRAQGAKLRAAAARKNLEAVQGSRTEALAQVEALKAELLTQGIESDRLRGMVGAAEEAQAAAEAALQEPAGK